MNTYIIIYTCIHGDALYRMMLNEYTRVGIGIQRCRARRHAMFYLLSVLLLLFIVFRFVGAQWHIVGHLPITGYLYTNKWVRTRSFLIELKQNNILWLLLLLLCLMLKMGPESKSL